VAEAATERRVTPDTAFPWLSMTKLATATAVMQLAERGDISVVAPVRRYLPGFPPAEPGRPVTVRHLLNHTAGLTNPFPLRWVHPANRPDPDPGRFARDLLRRHRRLRGTPGERARYSNLGYLALGEVIAAASGQSYQDYVRDHVLRPLGMTRTGFGYGDGRAEDAATGHQPRRHPLTPLLRAVLPPGIAGPARGRWRTLHPFCVDGAAYGGLIGSAADAARFLAMHAGDGELDGARVLRQQSAREMRVLSAHGRALDVASAGSGAVAKPPATPTSNT
jgi:CubicO group peptidase (beta-lactamase class C family)